MGRPVFVIQVAMLMKISAVRVFPRPLLHHQSALQNVKLPLEPVTVTQAVTHSALSVDNVCLNHPHARHNVLQNVEKPSVPVNVTQVVTPIALYVDTVPQAQPLSCRVVTFLHLRLAGASPPS